MKVRRKGGVELAKARRAGVEVRFRGISNLARRDSWFFPARTFPIITPAFNGVPKPQTGLIDSKIAPELY